MFKHALAMDTKQEIYEKSRAIVQYVSRPTQGFQMFYQRTAKEPTVGKVHVMQIIPSGKHQPRPA